MLPPSRRRPMGSDTKKLLDDMMAASGLPDAERRRMRAAAEGKAVERRRPPPNVLAARAGGGSAATQPYVDGLRGVPLNPRLCPTIGVRTQAGVLASVGGSMERPQFRGARPGVNRDDEKMRLQNVMTYGRAELGQPEAGGGAGEQPAPPPARESSEEARLHAAISREIEERSDFLNSMRLAGRAQEHEGPIAAQIAERVEELRRLEAMMASG